MFSLAVLALASIASSVNALVIPRALPPSPRYAEGYLENRELVVPPTYAQGYLELYKTYHTRYLALSCQTKHNTTFFRDCCHPMLATENLKDNRKAFCTPSPSALSVAAEKIETATDVPDVDFPKPTSIAASAPPKNVAPAPSPAPAPAPPPPPAAKPAPSPAPAPAPPAPKPSPPSSSDPFSNIIGNPFNGHATFFFQKGIAGACGTVHQDTDHVVALETSLYAGGAHCGKTIVIKDTVTGKTATGVVADECPTCDSATSIDLSHALFNEFAGDDIGLFNVKWGFTN